MKILKKLIKPLTRVVVWTCTAVGAFVIGRLAYIAVLPDRRTPGEQDSIDTIKTLINT